MSDDKKIPFFPQRLTITVNNQVVFDGIGGTVIGSLIMDIILTVLLLFVGFSFGKLM